MNLKQIRGLPVIGIDEATNLGAVERVFLDPVERRIVGFTVDTSGQSSLTRQTFGAMFGGSSTDPVITGYVRAEAVHSLGPDALTIDDRSGLSEHTTGPDGPGSTITADELAKLTVVTENGTRIGQIASVEIDAQRLVLTKVEVSGGLFKGNTTIPVDLVTSIGSELIVVADKAAEPSNLTEEDRESVEGPPARTSRTAKRLDGTNQVEQPAS